MTVAALEPEGSDDEIKRKFRETLERKRAKHADANAARDGKDAGKGPRRPRAGPESAFISPQDRRLNA